LDGWSILSLENNAQSAIVNAMSPKTLNLNLTKEKIYTPPFAHLRTKIRGKEIDPLDFNIWKGIQVQ
jgi:hypothetical protein